MTSAVAAEVARRSSTYPLTTSEAVAAALCGTLTATVAAGYVWGRVGRIEPDAMLWVTIAIAISLLVFLPRRRATGVDGAAAFAGVTAFTMIAALLAYYGWPSFLLPGRGPDLSHHLMLVDFIERNWRLPDGAHVGALVEMAHHTPGVHLLASFGGAWSGTDGFRAVYPVVAFTVALKSALIVLIALRALPAGPARVPLALTALVLCALPTRYFFGSLVEDAFLAQAAAELFAVAMWWAVVIWDARPSRLAAALFALMGIGAFLTWPMWIGPPIVVFAAIALTHHQPAFAARAAHLAIAFLPIAVVAALHTAGRVGWLATAGTTGVVLKPSIAVLGWPFLIAAACGIAAPPLRRETRVTFILALSIAAQALTLYALAQARGAAIPYMAFKMVYLIIYPLGVLGAAAVGWVVERHARFAARQIVIAAAVIIATGGALASSLARTPRAAPIVSLDLYEAGRWARGHLDAACVDYLVPHRETMHWLHLAVLGNPRSSPRIADPATFDPEKATVRWIEPAGLPYAIAYLPALPRDVANNVDVLEQFGDVAVVSRRGPWSCAGAQRLAGVESRKR